MGPKVEIKYEDLISPQLGLIGHLTKPTRILPNSPSILGPLVPKYSSLKRREIQVICPQRDFVP